MGFGTGFWERKSRGFWSLGLVGFGSYDGNWIYVKMVSFFTTYSLDASLSKISRSLHRILPYLLLYLERCTSSTLSYKLCPLGYNVPELCKVLRTIAH